MQHSAESPGEPGGAGVHAGALQAGAQVCCRGRLVRLSPLSGSGCERAGEGWEGEREEGREEVLFVSEDSRPTGATVVQLQQARQLVIRKRALRELLIIQQGNTSS